jgi:hypothetical protein
MHRRGYNPLRTYKQSKLANVLFTFELNRRLGDASPVRAYAADPGLVNTEIGLKGTTGIARWIWEKRRAKGRRPEEAAATLVFLAVDPSVAGSRAVYWKDCRPTPPSRYARRREEAARLWAISERLCGLATGPCQGPAASGAEVALHSGRRRPGFARVPGRAEALAFVAAAGRGLLAGAAGLGASAARRLAARAIPSRLATPRSAPITRAR